MNDAGVDCRPREAPAVDAAARRRSADAMSDAPRSIRFLFDYLSPYAYLAWTQIGAVAQRASVTVEPVPVLFAGLLNAHGQKGPAEIPSKRIYVFKDTVRRAQRLGVPLSPPPSHPFNPLLALRVTSLVPPADRPPLVDALFAATWGGRGAGVTDPAEVAALASAVGRDGPRHVAESAGPQAKAAVRRQTDEAIALGVFGVPTMLVGDELFWGLDSLELLEAHLAGNDPFAAVTPETMAAWSQIQPSATRR
jgi:2-hydroxychromene-2-carboxylate isomerase